MGVRDDAGRVDGATSPPEPDPTGPRASRTARTIGPRDHVYGDPRGLIQVVIYGDLHCSATADAYFAVHDAVFVHPCLRMTLRYVLLDDDPIARRSAATAEAVAASNLYWPFVDHVFRAGADPNSLRRHVRALGLDERLVDDRATLARSAPRFAEDQRLARAAGVTSMPTVFVNGVLWRPRPGASLRADLGRLAELTRPLWTEALDPRGRRQWFRRTSTSSGSDIVERPSMPISLARSISSSFVRPS
jgi:hypothetical protein